MNNGTQTHNIIKKPSKNVNGPKEAPMKEVVDHGIIRSTVESKQKEVEGDCFKRECHYKREIVGGPQFNSNCKSTI